MRGFHSSRTALLDRVITTRNTFRGTFTPVQVHILYTRNTANMGILTQQSATRLMRCIYNTSYIDICLAYDVTFHSCVHEISCTWILVFKVHHNTQLDLIRAFLHITHNVVYFYTPLIRACFYTNQQIQYPKSSSSPTILVLQCKPTKVLILGSYDWRTYMKSMSVAHQVCER